MSLTGGAVLELAANFPFRPSPKADSKERAALDMAQEPQMLVNTVRATFV